MELSEALFWRHLEYGREDDSWDYKADFSLSSKKQVAEFAKDVMAFANFGGGVMLFGIDEKTMSPVGVKEKVDQAALGDVMEKRLGINIDVQLFYFQGSGITLGLARIPASTEVIVASRDLHGENGKVVVQDGTIYYRRNTRSVRATSNNVRAILTRLSKSKSSSNVKVKNELSAIQSLHQSPSITPSDIYEVVADRYEPTAQAMGAKLWELWKFGSTYSKFEFAALLQIPPDQFDDYLEGKRSLTLGQVIASTKMFDLRTDYFFHASYNMRLPIWEEEIVRSALIHRIRPRSYADGIKPGSVYGSVLSKFAGAICEFHEAMYPANEPRISWIDEEVVSLPSKLVKDLSLQYYKILEQYPTQSDRGRELPQEQILKVWFHESGDYIARLIVEGIESISFDKNKRVRVKYRFMEDLRKQRVRFARYDSKNLVMTTRE